MGNKTSTKLSPELEDYAKKVFKKMDVDGSGAIDKKETVNHWNKNFANLNTSEMFKNLDKNNNDSVELDEWLGFWERVKYSRYKEEEIFFELKNIEQGKSWAYFTLDKKEK